MIRLDANGAWEVDEAREAIPAMASAAGVVPIEYVEQPCLTVDELAQVRRSVDVPIAADESIRRAEESPRRWPARRPPTSSSSRSRPSEACAPHSRSPARAASASSCPPPSRRPSACRSASPPLPPCPVCPGAGLATASLLVGDVTQPLIPERGRLPVRRLEPDRELIDRTPVDGDLVSRWGMRLEGMAEHLRVGSR